MDFRPGKKVKRIFELLEKAGAKDCMFVGGCVRDHLLGISSKDIDLEIYGLDYETIVETLRPFFRINLVGRSFGVIKVDHDIDLCVPRRESKTGIGHTAFEVQADSNLTPQEAFGRRDFTINAIGMRRDGSFCDPYDGRGDLQNKILRATSEAFCEDPLRVLRGVQFAARFGFAADEKTIELSKRVLPEFESLAPERIWTEWAKWAQKGRFPSKGLQFLRQTRWIEKFPELAELEQRGVFERTMSVCDHAAQIASERKLESETRIELLLAALAHDFAGERGDAVTNFLERMRAPIRFGERTAPLVRQRDTHLVTEKGIEPEAASVRRLAVRLAPNSIRRWGDLCTAIARANASDEEEHLVRRWVDFAEKLGYLDAAPEPILRGRDLLGLGVPPGKAMGRILKAAFELQLDGHLTTLDQALQWAKTFDKEAS